MAFLKWFFCFSGPKYTVLAGPYDPSGQSGFDKIIGLYFKSIAKHAARRLAIWHDNVYVINNHTEREVWPKFKEATS